MCARKVLIVSENIEKFHQYYKLMAGQMDAEGILRSESFEEARKLLQHVAVDFLVMEPKTFLDAEVTAKPQKSLPARITGHAREDLDYVRSYIFAHYREKLTLETLSALISVTPNHLCHVFRQAEGIGVREFLERTRLERAAALLCGTEDPVTVIARKVGFRSDSYFCMKFRASYGITPKQYRLRSRKKS